MHRDVRSGPLDGVGAGHFIIAGGDLDQTAHLAVEVNIRAEKTRPVQAQACVVADLRFLSGLADGVGQHFLKGLAVDARLKNGIGSRVRLAGGDIVGDAPRQRLEVVALGHEIRFATDGGQGRDPPIGTVPGHHGALGGLSLGALGQRGQTLLAQKLHRLLDVSPGFLERFLAVHHALAGHLPQFHHSRG